MVFIRTADDEEPDCNRCEHVCESDDFCSRLCGAEKRMAYVRKVYRERWD